MSCIEGPWNGIASPCKGCGKRHVGCHSTCREYIEYSAENARRREEKRRAANASFNPNVQKRSRKGGR